MVWSGSVSDSKDHWWKSMALLSPASISTTIIVFLMAVGTAKFNDNNGGYSEPSLSTHV